MAPLAPNCRPVSTQRRSRFYVDQSTCRLLEQQGVLACPLPSLFAHLVDWGVIAKQFQIFPNVVTGETTNKGTCRVKEHPHICSRFRTFFAVARAPFVAIHLLFSLVHVCLPFPWHGHFT